jgi:hypothetical protein
VEDLCNKKIIPEKKPEKEYEESEEYTLARGDVIFLRNNSCLQTTSRK